MGGHRARLVDILNDPGPEALDAFLRHWHGVALPVEAEHGALPVTIRRLIAAQAGQPSIVRQNRLVTDPDGEVRDGLRVFLWENQGNDWWAVAEEADDTSPVWTLKLDDDHLTLEAEPLSRFLLQMVVFEAIFSAASTAAADWLTLPELDRVIAPLTPLPFATWRWPDVATWLYAGDDVIAVVMTGRPGQFRGPSDHFSVDLAALRPETLSYLADIPIADWRIQPPGNPGYIH